MISYVLLIAIPLIILSLFHARTFAQKQRAFAANRLQEAALGIAGSVHDHLQAHIAAVATAARLVEDGKRYDPATLTNVLKETRSQYGGLITMLVADDSGKIIAVDPEHLSPETPSPIGSNIRDRPYFQEAMKSSKPYLSGAFLGRGFGNDPIVAISASIQMANGRRLVMEGSLNLASFRRLDERYAAIEQSPIAIVDSTPRLVYASPELNEPVLQDMAKTRLWAAGKAHTGQPFEFDYHGTSTMVVGHAPVEGVGWHVYVGQPLAVTQVDTDNYYRLTAALALLALFIAILTARWISNAVIGPMEQLVHAVNTFSAAGTPVKVALPKFASKEVSTLIREFGEMTAWLTEERYRGLIDSSAAFICTHKLDGTLLYVNPAAATALGFTVEEIKGRNLGELMPSEALARFPEYLQRVKAADTYAGTLRLVTKAGETRVLTFSNVLVNDPGKEPFVLGIGVDITEVRRASEVLKNQEQYLRLLLEGSSDVVCIMETDGRLRYISPTAKKMFGYTPEEKVGENAFVDIHPEDVDRVQATLSKLMQDVETPQRVQYRVRHTNGSWVDVEAVGANRLADPVMKGIVGNIRDNTERKRAELERERLIAELQDALGKVKTLSGLLPICAWCRKIRDDEGKWNSLEAYITQRTEAKPTHGLCPECAQKHFPAESQRPTEA
ncbi:MAG: PAS domain S-box protein [Acidobacteriales bacterium]|nr:PAS domain S-box protein [Terriglobales bacterium]